jgi:hypothetical protein
LKNEFARYVKKWCDDAKKNAESKWEELSKNYTKNTLTQWRGRVFC